jgi:membrane protein DedA with SNARE-associated domain
VNVTHLISSYGYWAVFIPVAAESTGIPFPGETVVIAAGAYAGETHRMSVWGIFVVAVAAVVVGGAIGFGVGEFGGYRLLRRYGHYIRMDDAKIKIGRYLFDRYGWIVVIFGHFVSILRAYIALLAGTSRMRWLRFLLFNAVGGMAWAAVFAFGAYGVGDNLTNATAPIGIAAGSVAAVALVAAIVVVRRHAGRLASVAEAAYPGPLPD